MFPEVADPTLPVWAALNSRCLGISPLFEYSKASGLYLLRDVQPEVTGTCEAGSSIFELFILVKATAAFWGFADALGSRWDGHW